MTKKSNDAISKAFCDVLVHSEKMSLQCMALRTYQELYFLTLAYEDALDYIANRHELELTKEQILYFRERVAKFHYQRDKIVERSVRELNSFSISKMRSEVFDKLITEGLNISDIRGDLDKVNKQAEDAFYIDPASLNKWKNLISSWL